MTRAKRATSLGLAGAVVTVLMSVVSIAPAGATAANSSKVQFAETYLKINGHKITESQAVALVNEYPSIPTMAQAASLGFSTHPTVIVAKRPDAAGESGCSDVGAQFVSGGGEFWWWQN